MPWKTEGCNFATTDTALLLLMRFSTLLLVFSMILTAAALKTATVKTSSYCMSLKQAPSPRAEKRK